jgi:hypothetical protein
VRKPSVRKSLVIGVAAGCLLVTAVTTDRVAASAAAERLATRLRCAIALPSPPSVSFGGVPFLSQLARGRFDSIRIAADGVPAGRFRVDVEATATGVRLPEGGAARADAVTATITVGYDLLRATSTEAQSGPDPSSPAASGAFAGEVTADDSGRLLISATRTLFGQEIPVVVVANPEITGGTLTIHPVEVEVPSVGLRFPATRFAALKQLPSADLPALPDGLDWTAVTATPGGLRLTVEGADLTTDGLPAGGGAAARCGAAMPVASGGTA